jgi:hypothetical protein
MGCGPMFRPGAEAWDILMEDTVHTCSDAACSGVVDPITKRVGRIAHEYATESLRIQIATLVVKGFGTAAEHTERCIV